MTENYTRVKNIIAKQDDLISRTKVLAEKQATAAASNNLQELKQRLEASLVNNIALQETSNNRQIELNKFEEVNKQLIEQLRQTQTGPEKKYQGLLKDNQDLRTEVINTAAREKQNCETRLQKSDTEAKAAYKDLESDFNMVSENNQKLRVELKKVKEESQVYQNNLANWKLQNSLDNVEVNRNLERTREQLRKTEEEFKKCQREKVELERQLQEEKDTAASRLIFMNNVEYSSKREREDLKGKLEAAEALAEARLRDANNLPALAAQQLDTTFADAAKEIRKLSSENVRLNVELTKALTNRR